MKLSKLVLIASVLVTPMMTQAAQKIAYVNTAQIFHELPQREAVQMKLQKEFKKSADEMKSLESKLKAKVEQVRRDAALLSEDDIRKLQFEVATLEAEYKLKGQSLERTSKQREAEEKQKLFKKIQTAIDAVAEKEGYDMVIDAQALQYAKPEYNLTEQVIKKLK